MEQHRSQRSTEPSCGSACRRVPDVRSHALVLRSRVGVSARALWEVRGLVLGALLAISGVVGLVVPVPSWLAWFFAVLGLVVSLVELRRLRNRPKWAARPNDVYQDVQNTLSTNARCVVSGGQVCAIMLGESKRLRASAIRIKESSPYRVDPRIKELAFKFTTEQIRRAALWNDLALGLASDPPKESEDSEVFIRVCDYLDHVGTDLLATHDIRSGSSGVSFSGRDLVVAGQGRLRPLKGSWLANLVGVSTLAFTSDGKLVLVWQAPDNYNSPGLFAPSGSGALAPADLVGASDLQTLVMRGANRELCEETGVLSSEIGHTEALGFARWLSKGGMPEFYGYTLLGVTSDELDLREIPRDERRFTGERLTLRLPPTDQWFGGPESILGERVGSASVPLLCAIAILADLVRTKDPSVEPLIDLLGSPQRQTTELGAEMAHEANLAAGPQDDVRPEG